MKGQAGTAYRAKGKPRSGGSGEEVLVCMGYARIFSSFGRQKVVNEMSHRLWSEVGWWMSRAGLLTYRTSASAW